MHLGIETYRAFARAPFEPLRQERFTHELHQTPDETVSLSLSLSSLASLPENERAEIGRRLRELVDEPRQFRFRVDLYWTRVRG